MRVGGSTGGGGPLSVKKESTLRSIIHLDKIIKQT